MLNIEMICTLKNLSFFQLCPNLIYFDDLSFPSKSHADYQNFISFGN